MQMLSPVHTGVFLRYFLVAEQESNQRTQPKGALRVNALNFAMLAIGKHRHFNSLRGAPPLGYPPAARLKHCTNLQCRIHWQKHSLFMCCQQNFQARPVSEGWYSGSFLSRVKSRDGSFTNIHDASHNCSIAVFSLSFTSWIFPDIGNPPCNCRWVHF